MALYIVSNKTLQSINLTLLTGMVHRNFVHLANVSSLSHTKKEIQTLLLSNTAQVYLILINNKICAYLIGNIMNLTDGRTVLYVTYLFTSKKYRGKGLASKLMDIVEQRVKKFNLDGTMLTCDTEDDYIYDFYLKKGFMPDIILRRYEKYDVMFK